MRRVVHNRASEYFSFELKEIDPRVYGVAGVVFIKSLKVPESEIVKFDDITDILYHKYPSCHGFVKGEFKFFISIDDKIPKFYSYKDVYNKFNPDLAMIEEHSFRG